MVSDRRRAALIGCSILAVLIGASLFPAAGFGDYPGTEAVDSEYYASAGDGDLIDDSTADDGSSGESDDSTADDEPGDADDDSDGTDDQPDETADEPDQSDNDTGTERDDAETTTNESDDGLFPLLFLLVGGFGIGGVVVWKLTDPTRSAEISPEDLPSGFIPRLRFRFSRIPQLTMSATIGLSRVLPSVFDGLSSATRAIAIGLGHVTRDVGKGVSAVTIALPTALAGAGSGLFSGISSPFGGLASLFDSARSTALRATSTSRSTSRPRTTTQTTADDPDPDPEIGPRTIEETWDAMVDELPVRRLRTRTPGEYARTAVDIGLPERPVSQLTDAFREIRYGGQPPSPDRTKRAREAFDEIQQSRDEDEQP